MVEREGFEPSKAYAGRFTVCSLWPLGHLSPAWSRWPESNWQPTDYKSVALPLSYIGPRGKGRRTVDLRYIPPPGAKPAYYQCPSNLSSWPNCRATSYIATAPATEALSDSTPARRGMAARRSHVRSTKGRRPVSPPRT